MIRHITRQETHQGVALDTARPNSFYDCVHLLQSMALIRLAGSRQLPGDFPGNIGE